MGGLRQVAQGPWWHLKVPFRSRSEVFLHASRMRIQAAGLESKLLRALKKGAEMEEECPLPADLEEVGP